MSRGGNARAVLERFGQVIGLHAVGLLKVGYCQIELGNREAARTALQQVMRQYPDTTAARLASQRLDRLSQEGG